jgi:hypothetical protein
VKRTLAALALCALALAVPTAALAGSGNGNGPKGDVIDVGKDVKVKKPKKQDLPASVPALSNAAVAAAAGLESPPVGTVKIWPLINFNTGGAQLANFTLRAVGVHTEIWVANNLNYPGGAADCRNDGVRNVITDAQAVYLQGEFDENMYDKMTAAFSSPPSRDGTDAELEDILPALFPEGYFNGPGDKIVTLVANFQDENFLDINFPSYVAGYHSSDINAFVNRNVMSIDSFDWVHRTGPNPPHEPSTVLCENKTASPFRYEGIFAHEYQHLLEFWASPGESTWVNEGLSDYAITVTGYGFPARTIDEPGWDSHIQTFLGWRALATPANLIPQPLGGPENSLTVWDDQGGLETLSDYGAAWTFMELLHSRYGDAFMTDFHNEDANGLAGLQAVLDKYLTGKTTRELIHEWAAMVALDRSIDGGAKLRGAANEADYQADELHAAIYWENPQAYSTPGAPPNGSDYVELRDAAGNPVAAKDVQSIEFSGDAAHAAPPMEWQSVVEGGDAILSAGAAADIDRSIVRSITVPASGDRSLVFDTKYNIETGWDFGVVQISTDGGLRWTSLGNDDTTSEHDGGALGSIVAQLPGFNGVSDWKTTTFDLSAYSGQTVLLRFRMMTDEFQLGNNADESGAGWWVDDVKVGGTLLSDGTLAGWATPAPPIESYTVQLVGLDSKNAKQAILAQVPLANGRTASLTGGALRSLLGNHAGTVAAIVSYDESTESITAYAPYELKVNGVLQPGG